MNMKPTIERLIRAVITVVSLPTIYTRLDEAIQSDAPNKIISRIISDDAGLAARLLRIANSPFYGFPSRIDTISRAVTIIGTRQLTQLVLAISVIEMFEEKVRGRFNLMHFWKHSIACAVAARLLATYRREPNIEKYFVIGLLHDIGRLVMMMVVPEEGKRILEIAHNEDRLLHDVEQEVLGFDHARVGGELLRQWKLPMPLVESVSCHHMPNRARDYRRDAALAHVAEIVSNAMLASEGVDEAVPAIEEDAWEALELPLTILSPLFEQMCYQVDEAVQFIFPGEAAA